MRGLRQFLNGGVDALDVSIGNRPAGLFDCGFNRLGISLCELLAIFLEKLLSLIDQVVGTIARFSLRHTLLVLIGVRLGFLAHALRLVFTETGGSCNRDFLFFVLGFVFGRYVQYAV